MRSLLALLLLLPAAENPASAPRAAEPKTAALDAVREQVRAREQAFAKTMADRDHAAFTSFLSEETVFAGATVLRGRQTVADGWKRFFEGPQAPFSWAPEVVEVIGSGTLALSKGPVFDPSGKRTGTFTSTWRLEKDGVWRIVLDTGCPPCRCGEEAAKQP
jgi:ketosteroid isomerase-like protein